MMECGALQEHEARWFFQQLIVGLDYCHKMVRLSAPLHRCSKPRAIPPRLFSSRIELMLHGLDAIARSRWSPRPKSQPCQLCHEA